MGSLNEKNPSRWVGTPARPSSGRYPAMSRPTSPSSEPGFGLTAAALLKQDGQRVAVVEAGRVASGATGYITAKLTALHQGGGWSHLELHLRGRRQGVLHRSHA